MRTYMPVPRIAAVVLSAFVAVLSACATTSGPIRIDASSDDAANRSFNRMTASLHGQQQLALMVAMIQLNFTGLRTAEQIASNPDLQHPSAARIKDTIAGMSANEIIDLAKRTATTTVSINAKDPGVPADLLRPLHSEGAADSVAGSTWMFVENVNGYLHNNTYALHADHSAVLIESELKSPKPHRWEQSGDELRLSINDGYSVFLGHQVAPGKYAGEAANATGLRWTWTATRR